MGKKKGKPSLPPRRKRMKRQARLQSARAWLEQYQGEKVAAAYRKRYGVDWACTFKELEMLGVELDPEYVKSVLQTVEGQAEAQQRKKAQQEGDLEAGLIEQDENFAFIVGYTPGGAPYGITWEEWEALDYESEEDVAP